MSIIRLLSLALFAGILVPALVTGGNALPEARAAYADPDVAQAAAGVRLEVSLADRQLRVIRDGDVVKSYTVAIGQAEYPTPTGNFAIGRVVWNPSWVPPEAEWAKDETVKAPGDPDNPMGKVKLFFREPDYYIHGTDAEDSLGRAASHGCLRMANRDVVELAQLVMENGGETRSPGWFRRIINFVRSTHEVRLSSPVPLTVAN